MSGMESGKEPQQDKQKDEGKRQNLYLMKIGLMIFITFVCCILFFFCVLRFQGFTKGWSKFFRAGQPIIIGLVLAYLLNPIAKFLEDHLIHFFEKHNQDMAKAKKASRALGIGGAIIFLIVILVLLVALIVPSVISSVSGLVVTLPGNVQHFIDGIQNGRFGNFKVTDTIGDLLTKATDYVEGWVKDLLPQAKKYLVNITSGVISAVKTLLNFVVGIIVAVYVLMIKERLIGQSKKAVYAIFKTKHANIIIEILHKADEIFGGFISGKIIDSAIIGVICYLGCSILRIPNAELVAVIVGVTNIIPVFGPFIGAVPSLLLVVIESPWHALYLLIFIIVLQQVDGNIIGPKILGSSTGLSSFWVMFAILIGGGLFGFLGMLLGVPVFAMIYYVLRRLVNYGIRKKQLPEETEKYTMVSGVDSVSRELRYYPEEKKKPAEEEKDPKPEKKK
ncbi:MAG: AI-2E family transporter [Agathobacter sp.]